MSRSIGFNLKKICSRCPNRQKLINKKREKRAGVAEGSRVSPNQWGFLVPMLKVEGSNPGNACIVSQIIQLIFRKTLRMRRQEFICFLCMHGSCHLCTCTSMHETSVFGMIKVDILGWHVACSVKHLYAVGIHIPMHRPRKRGFSEDP